MPLNILHIDSSAPHEGLVSRQLSAHAVTQFQDVHPDAIVIRRDLTQNPLPSILPEFLEGTFGETSDAIDVEALYRSDELIAELLTSDVLIIGAPMYNFGIPVQLKIWVDHICREGKTYKLSQTPQGLVTGKRAIIVSGAGGAYNSSPLAAVNHAAPYMKKILSHIGFTDIQIAVAEKQGFGPEAAASGLTEAFLALETAIKHVA